jgi:hypothetical protein
VRALLGAALAVALPAAPSFLLLRATVAPLRAEGRVPLALAAALALPLGLGATSLLAFGWVVLVGAPGSGYAVAEAALLAAAAWAAAAAGARAPAAPGGRAPWTRGDRALAAAIGVAACAAAAAFVLTSRRVPDGDWDAWAMWNLRARLIARADGPGAALAIPVAHAHLDYPLLLPLTVARLWAFAGAQAKAAPALAALAFTAAAVAIPSLAAALARGRRAGLLVAGVLLATHEVVSQGRAQYADVPLAALVAAAVALVAIAEERRAPAALVAAGLAAGCAAWTKNEGLLLAAALAAVLAARAAAGRLPARALAALAAGAAPALLAVAAFKVRSGAESYLTAGRTAGEVLALALDPSRAALILSSLAGELARFGHGVLALGAAVALLVGRGDAARRPAWPLALLGVALAGYVAVYLVTPHDLAWQLRTSLARLLLQLWPALALAVALRAPDLSEGRAPPPAA